MRGGALRHRTVVERETTIAGAKTGEVTPTWSSFANWPCSITPLRGEELANARQQYASVTHSLRGRYVTGVTPHMRVTKGTRIFRIDAVINVEERNRELEVLATEIVP